MNLYVNYIGYAPFYVEQTESFYINFHPYTQTLGLSAGQLSLHLVVFVRHQNVMMLYFQLAILLRLLQSNYSVLTVTFVQTTVIWNQQ